MKADAPSVEGGLEGEVVDHAGLLPVEVHAELTRDIPHQVRRVRVRHQQQVPTLYTVNAS